mmetsp:Transcript_10857/g.17076  ORF Transcript_10857/g.17076 Transcript_10857/m.17076 type:complete len:137 (-) Transcript_10857:74-484(-)
MSEDRRVVEVGRVCLINYGDLEGKLCVIVNVIDGKKCLIDGPSSVNGVARQVMPYKRLALTNIKINIAPNARINTLKKAFDAGEVQKKWAASAWALRLAKKAAKKSLGDFDRFKLMVARKTRARVVNTAMKKMAKK